MTDCNSKKIRILNEIYTEVFDTWDSNELSDAAEELKTPWHFDPDTQPTKEKYLSTFPSLDSENSKKNIVKMLGRINGRLRIIGYGGKTNQGKIKYKHECQCGKLTTGPASGLISCGCLKGPLNRIKARERSVKKLEEKIGEKHNRLTIVGVSTERISDKGMVLVQCNCGSEEFSVVHQSLIPRGRNQRVNTKSCGCYEREQTRKRHRENALKHVDTTKHFLRIDKLDGYDTRSSKQLAHATCLACNTETIIRLNDYLTGRNKSCGCLQGTTGQRKSYVGRRIFYLEVLGDAEDRILKGGRTVRFALCKCHACGREDYEVRLDNIINEQQVSCGCIQFRDNDNLISFLTNSTYATRKSTTYLVEAKVGETSHLKIGIAYNFLNRKSVAKNAGTPYIRTITKPSFSRDKSWLLEQIVLLRLKKYKMMSYRGKIKGGTEMFNNRLKEDVLKEVFSEEAEKLKSTSFLDRLAEMNCEVPLTWIRGYKFK